jgi:hypothetical protein
MIVSARGRTDNAVLGRIFIVVAALLIASAVDPAWAQSAAADQAIKLQKEFQDKCVAGDVDAVSAMMAEDAIFIHGNGAMQGKSEFLGSLKSGQLSLSAYDLKDPKVILFNGGAIVSRTSPSNLPPDQTRRHA